MAKIWFYEENIPALFLKDFEGDVCPPDSFLNKEIGSFFNIFLPDDKTIYGWIDDNGKYIAEDQTAINGVDNFVVEADNWQSFVEKIRDITIPK